MMQDYSPAATSVLCIYLATHDFMIVLELASYKFLWTDMELQILFLQNFGFTEKSDFAWKFYTMTIWSHTLYDYSKHTIKQW